jgi:hypothetical protein
MGNVREAFTKGYNRMVLRAAMADCFIIGAVVPARDLRLLLDGYKLEDGHNLAYDGIGEGDVLEFHLSMRGD